VGAYRHPLWKKVVWSCWRTWEPPVHIPAIGEYIRSVMAWRSVVGIWYDPTQWAAEAQKLEEEGVRCLHEVTQTGTYMITIATNLQTLCQRNDILIPKDPQLRNQLSWCAIKSTEMGPRIVKSRQSRPIDAIIAGSMATWGASQDAGHLAQKSFDATKHLATVEDLV
jgi:hypothetical protein